MQVAPHIPMMGVLTDDEGLKYPTAKDLTGNKFSISWWLSAWEKEVNFIMFGMGALIIEFNSTVILRLFFKKMGMLRLLGVLFRSWAAGSHGIDKSGSANSKVCEWELIYDHDQMIIGTTNSTHYSDDFHFKGNTLSNMIVFKNHILSRRSNHLI